MTGTWNPTLTTGTLTTGTLTTGTLTGTATTCYRSGRTTASLPSPPRTTVSSIRSNHSVMQAAAASALGQFMRDSACLAAMDGRFAGGMHVIVRLLYKPQPPLQAALAMAVAHCAKRPHMLAVLTGKKKVTLPSRASGQCHHDGQLGSLGNPANR
eukprot:4583192-Pyramimonas_sp.AAC.1